MHDDGQPDPPFRTFEYRLPRLHAGFPFWLQIETEHKALIAGACTDISDEGLGADLEEPLPVGFQLTLLLPSALKPEAFAIRACVASQHGQRHGFAFLPAHPQQTEEVAALIYALGNGVRQRCRPELMARESKDKAG